MRRANVVCIAAVVILACGPAIAATKVVEWKFDGNLNDTSGNGIHGVEYPSAGSAVYDTGVSGQAFVSGGSNSVYKTGISSALLPVLGADTWSVNVWMYPTAIPTDWQLAWCLGDKPFGDKNSRSVYSSGFSATGIGFLTFVGDATPPGGSSSEMYIVTYLPWDINAWQMITATYDGSIVRLYRNGVLVAMRDKVFYDAPGEVRIPSHSWNSTGFLAGKYDEFTVWRGALSVTEIADLVEEGGLPPVKVQEQTIYYKMEDIAGVLPDHSGLAHDGSLYGYTAPLSDWLADGLRNKALLFNGGQMITPPVAVCQPVNFTVSFWFKSGHQPYTTAFYSEKQVNAMPGNYAKGTQLLIRANNAEIQALHKERDYNTLFLIAGDASAYMDGVTWNHLALVADGEAAKATIYINGNQFGQVDYVWSSHKTTGLNVGLGYSWQDDGFLGEWDSTYVDEVKIWNGALTAAQVRAVAAQSNYNNDMRVDLEDAAFMAGEWKVDYQTDPGATQVVDDMEGTLTSWAVYPSSTYTGTGTLSATSNAYEGSAALQWDYLLPGSNEPNDNYTSIVYDFGAATDLSSYDELNLQLYRHTGNTAEDLLFLKFIDAGQNVKAESWITDGGAVVDPVDEWQEWVIDTTALMGSGGSGTAGQSDLTAIRYIMIGTGSSDRADARSGTIDIDAVQLVRYPICSAQPEADLIRDCKVDILDLAVIADEWLLGIE